MGKLRQMIGDDGPGYATAVPTAATAVDLEVQAQVRRYEQECGPVVTKPLIEWCKPAAVSVNSLKKPCLRVGKHELSLNKAAVELLGKPIRLAVGVTIDGLLAVKPATDASGYGIYYGHSTATLGKDRIVRWLQERGIGQGLYELERDDKLGVFVGRRLE